MRNRLWSRKVEDRRRNSEKRSREEFDNSDLGRFGGESELGCWSGTGFVQIGKIGKRRLGQDERDEGGQEEEDTVAGVEQRWEELSRQEGGSRRHRTMSSKVAAVVGVGPGLGLAISRKFARHGFTVAILARNYDKLMKYAEQLVEKEASAQVAAIRIDCSDAKSIKDAFEAVNSLGTVDILVYNTNTPFPWPPPRFTDISADSFERNLNISCVGAFHCVQQVVRGMIERKRGTILFTGATGSIRGSAGFSEFACGKFALRALGQSLARELHPQGIHVAHIIIDGVIRNNTRSNDSSEEERSMSPDDIAEAYWQLHIQEKSAWTQELDLRPFSEKF